MVAKEVAVSFDNFNLILELKKGNFQSILHIKLSGAESGAEQKEIFSAPQHWSQHCAGSLRLRYCILKM